MKKLFLILILGAGCFHSLEAQKYSTKNGAIHFISNAPLEIIQASSNDLRGILDLESRSFAFEVSIQSFQGFNSPLQQEHFYENYMEIRQFPKAQFVGKILEYIPSEIGEYRAKGTLKIHGVSNEVLIDLKLNRVNDEFQFETSFEAALVDFDIRLPKIVFQKVAERILVTVSGTLTASEM